MLPLTGWSRWRHPPAPPGRRGAAGRHGRGDGRPADPGEGAGRRARRPCEGEGRLGSPARRPGGVGRPRLGRLGGALVRARARGRRVGLPHR
ncbi:hypothetical protein NL676_032150 [Syzygium grande]|nr:hypothetical protein NL676_032150 [Syzygium grande]